MTKVTVPTACRNLPHRHEGAEQIWHILIGSGVVTLDGGMTIRVDAGDTIRFEDGDLHGLENDGDVPIEYVSVTSPPQNFRTNYERGWGQERS